LLARWSAVSTVLERFDPESLTWALPVVMAARVCFPAVVSRSAFGSPVASAREQDVV
jgi:hypothetical protein